MREGEVGWEAYGSALYTELSYFIAKDSGSKDVQAKIFQILTSNSNISIFLPFNLKIIIKLNLFITAAT